ncbi:MAG: hypothetical protein JWN86_3199 [Planctomycetota bacterium]|nr:hypothetical protein [Planctomycetota bacterium]
MHRDRGTFGAAALLAGLLCATPAMADDPKPDDIAIKMGGVVDSLGRKLTGTPVQGEQKQIVRDLDDLIASLEKQCQACKNGIKRNNPNRGMADSTISAGTGGIGTLANAGDGGKDWAKISERERDRILQSMSEGFPPEYRTVLERYYRRLAEEKSAKAPGGAAKATAKDEAGSARPATP